jgi:transposase
LSARIGFAEQEVNRMQGRRSKRGYRQHGAEFKRRVLAECAAPGVRIAEVAAAHGLAPALIYSWRRRAAETVLRTSATVASFVPATATDGAAAAIRIELRRGDIVAQVHWPLTAAGACGQWLRNWLR